MYKIFIFLLISMSLVGCSLPGTQSESSDIAENTVLFEDTAISVLVPKTWSG
jgi:uncharacterized protein YcfL